MKYKLTITTLIVALLLAILWSAHHFNFIEFIKRMHGG